jgi:drug/metabolite transporter (DMT)-like permease
MTSDMLGVAYALLSAAVWGSGDFSGGLAARKISPFQVLLLTSSTGMLLLLVCGWVFGETLPAWRDVYWAISAGLAGAFGIAMLYKALALGSAASAAPTAGVVTALVPVLFTALTLGLPAADQLAGFGLALVGIWLVARLPGGRTDATRQGMLLALLSGVCFGAYFVLVAQVSPGKVFYPLLAARLVSFTVALTMLALQRLSLPNPQQNPAALLSGVLDTGGNIFYLLAAQFTRLDVAAVLASFYPAATVMLSVLLLKERVSPWQWLGVACCLGAVVLISG